MYKLILISIILIFTYNLSAQTYVSGNISGTWDLSGSPYIVTNNITVVDLEIEPGVEVLFNDNYSFTITGNFTAIGTAQDSIYFKPNVSNSNGWKGITFNSESEGLKLSYCAIESSTENGVAVNTGSVIISNSRISNSTRSGLYVKNSTVDLEKNILNNNQENGLNLNTNSSAHIYTTLIRNNNSAGLYFEGAGIELYNSVIAQNHAEGIQIISPSDTFKCYNSTIVSNQTGLFNTDAAVWLENSIFWDNGVTEISNFGGNVDAKFCFIDAATMPDDLNDLGGNIVSTNSPGFVESSNYQLSETSVCVDGGNPDPAFYDQYFPPSLSTNINDIGAYGGPNAGKWYHPIFVNPANLNFGKVSWDSSKILKIVLKNYRNYPISVSDLDISGNDSEKYKLINEPPSYPYTIAIGDSLEVEVEFIPGEGSGQPFTGILNIQNDISPEIVNMTGMGVQANITLIPPSSLDFEDTQVTESSSRMLRIYNTGNDSLKISEFEMSNTDVFSTDVEWITVAPGLNDTVYVEFKPDSAEDYTETLIIHSNARGNENKSITLSGKGRSPVIHANQLLVDFGSIEIDSVKNSQISIQNIGNEELVLASAEIAGKAAAQFDFMPEIDSIIIPSGGEPLELNLKFSPKDTSGWLSTTLQVVNNDPKRDTLNIILQGESLAPVLTFDSTIVDFGEVRLYTDSLIDFTLENTGGLELIIDTLYFENEEDTAFQLEPVSMPMHFLPESGPQSIQLHFKPLSEDHKKNTLVVVSNDYRQDTSYIEITGSGVAPQLALDPLNIRFGEVRLGKSDSIIIKMENSGTGHLEIKNLLILGTNQESFSIGEYVFPLLIGGEDGLDSIIVSFNPVELDTNKAQLKINSNDIDTSETTINLSGVGVASFISSDTSNYDFGRVKVDSNATLFVKIWNKNGDKEGNADLNVSKVYFKQSEVFKIEDSDTTFTIPAGSDLNEIKIQFEPEKTGEVSDTLFIISDAYDADTLKLNFTGFAYEPGVPIITIINDNPIDFDSVFVDGESSLVLTIKNNGEGEGADLAVSNIELEGPDLNFFSVTPSILPLIIKPGEEKVADTLKFSPDSERKYSASLKVSSNDPDSSTWIQKLEGVGKLDQTPPQFSLTSTANQFTVNQAATLNINIEDNDSKIQSAELFVRKAGKSNFTDIQMSSTDNISWSAQIPDSLVTERGMEYYVSAEHGGVSSQYPARDDSSPGVINVTVPTYQIPFKTLENDYQQISIPFSSEGQTLKDLFGDELGSYKNTKYRFFDWNEEKSEFTELSDMKKVLTPGHSVYLITKDPHQLGILNCKTALVEGGLNLDIHKGWNMISTPYDFPVLWQDILPGSDGMELAHYNGTAWDYPDSLEPFKGYGYWSEKDTVLIIPVKEANINSRKTLAKGSGEGEWNIQIQARCGEYNDLYNFAGMKLNARDQFDRTDRMEPPVPGKGISLYFKQQDDLSNQIKLTSDYRSPKDDLFLYDFEFKCDFSDKTLLNFVANKLPDDYDWIVISKEGNVILPKGEISSNRKSKSYQLIVGNRSALNEVEKDFKPVPKTFRVSQNYPNPFNPVTKITIELPKEVYIHIDIFDILGRKVKTLVNGKLIEEGYHQFEWDGTNTSGHSVATGIYFLNFRSPDYTKTIKMILSR